MAITVGWVWTSGAGGAAPATPQSSFYSTSGGVDTPLAGPAAQTKDVIVRKRKAGGLAKHKRKVVQRPLF